MRTNRNSRGKISRCKYTKTITLNKGIATDANQKVTKTIVVQNNPNKKSRTLGEMVYESLNTPAYFAYMKRFESKKHKLGMV